MKVIPGFKSLDSTLFQSIIHPVVALGNFDGVHRGHQRIIQAALESAHPRRGQAIAYTFRPHPQKVLRPQTPIELLTTYDEKLSLLAELGVDLIVEEPFVSSFFNFTPAEFFTEVLQNTLHAEGIVVGYDFSFGKGRQGHLDLLSAFCHNAGIQLTIIPPQETDHEVISSSKIRTYLAEGNIERANQLLGRPFSYEGNVIHGDQRGRKIGFPTANLAVPENKIVLPFGVYATTARIGDQSYKSITNIGIRPTFQAATSQSERSPAPLVETHLLETSSNPEHLDLYGKTLKVNFHSRIRPEMKFSSVEELKAQIKQDIASLRAYP